MTDTAAVQAVLDAVALRLTAAAHLDTSAPDALLTAVAESAVVALDSQAASIAVLDADGTRLTFRAAAGPAAGSVVGMSIDAAAGIAGYAVTSGQPLAVADAPSDPRFDRTVAEATGYVPSTLLAAPLIDETGTVGVLEALDHRGGSFTLRDLDVATAIARTATAVVRAGTARRDAATLLSTSLREIIGTDGPVDDAAIEALVSSATENLEGEGQDTVWPLADRIARLRDVDPGSVELATEWLDALLRRATPRRGPGR